MFDVDCMSALIHLVQTLQSIVPLPQDPLTVINELRTRRALVICASVPNYDVTANSRATLPSILNVQQVVVRIAP